VVQPVSWSLAGDGATTAFSIPNAATNAPDLYIVTIDGVYQKPATDYTVSVATAQITFTSAPALNAAIAVRSFGYARALSVGDSTFSVLATGTTHGAADAQGLDTALTAGTTPWFGVPRQSIIKARNSGDAGYLVASSQWLAAGSVSASNPWKVDGLDFDANGFKTYGVVVRAFFTKFYNCQFKGSTDTDLLFSTDARDGTLLSSTMVNNEVRHSWIGVDGSTAQYGIRTIDTNGKATDYMIVGNYFSGASVVNLWAQLSSGWVVAENHFYGTGPSSVYLYKPNIGTIYANNYSEKEVRFGSPNTSATTPVTYGPGNFFSTHVWADFNNTGNLIVSTGNTYSTTAELRHAYFDPSKVLVSQGDTFGNATPFKHYASAGRGGAGRKHRQVPSHQRCDSWHRHRHRTLRWIRLGSGRHHAPAGLVGPPGVPVRDRLDRVREPRDARQQPPPLLLRLHHREPLRGRRNGRHRQALERSVGMQLKTILAALLLALPVLAETKVHSSQVSGAPVSILDHGAKCDGVTDSAPAIRTAIAVAGIGGTVLIPGCSSTYLLNSYDAALSIYGATMFYPLSAQTIVGSPGAQLKVATGILNTNLHANGGIVFYVDQKDHVTLRGIRIDMNGANNLTPVGGFHPAYAFAQEGGSYVSFIGNEILNSPGRNGISITGCALRGHCSDQCLLRDNVIRNGGTTISGNVNQNDWSAFYVECTNSVIDGNRTVMDNYPTASIPQNGGIEIHGNHTVATNNQIDKAFPSFYVGSNAAGQDITDVTIANNTARTAPSRTPARAAAPARSRSA
jgi:hypothetical protein